VADTLRKHVPEPHKPNGDLDLSPSFYNKIGKMKIRPEFFESAASASSAIPAEGQPIEFTV